MGGHAAIMVKQRYQVTEMPNKAPRNYPQLSPLELLRGDLKGMFGAVAGSGLLPDDMQDLGVVGKYAPRECSNCGSDQVRVIFRSLNSNARVPMRNTFSRLSARHAASSLR